MLVPSTRPPRERRPTRFELVRASGRERVVVHLDTVDAAAFARAVGQVAPRIERSLRPEVLANRLGPDGRLAPWRPARERWRSEIDRRFRRARPPNVFAADVRECYLSIGNRALAASLRAAGAGHAEIDEVLAVTARFRDEGIRGLPVGPEPSAILANAVLARTDAALRAAGVAHLRWVDDFVAFAPDRVHARRALTTLRRSLADMGLELNDAKTWIALDPLDARERLRASPRSLASDPHGMMPAP